MEQIYYVKWRTWSEKEIHTPWDFWMLKEGQEYKPRLHTTSNLIITPQLIEQAWISQNTQLLDQIQNDFINDIHLMAFVNAIDPQQATNEIKRLFDDAQILHIVPVTQEQKTQIMELIEKTVKSISRS